jgi:hypothetical protein
MWCWFTLSASNNQQIGRILWSELAEHFCLLLLLFEWVMGDGALLPSSRAGKSTKPESGTKYLKFTNYQNVP